MLEGPIKLNMNEMPYPPPSGVFESALKGLSNLNRYTEFEDMERLRDLLVDYSEVKKEQIVLSPGSDILLREVIHSFSKDRKVVTVSPSFFPTVESAKRFSTKWVSIRLSPSTFELNPEIIMGQLNVPSLVIIDNPNNPTGRLLLDREMVESITEMTNTLLVIDEAYYEFAGVTYADMVQDHPNLAVTRTMDKSFSLAGARIGYIIAGEAFLDGFVSFYPFLPRSSLYAAAEALRELDYMRKNVHRVIEERERVRRTIEKSGALVYSSDTNFLLMRTDVSDLRVRLEEMGIFICDLSNQLSPGFFRVSIGKREENDAFISGYLKIIETRDHG
jgi:histidinol-phosphate aminotransferase